MKNSEIKALNNDELKQKLASEQESYKKLKFAHAVSPVENPMKIKVARKIIARLNTEVRARELQK